jgi:hypothetical protein
MKMKMGFFLQKIDLFNRISVILKRKNAKPSHKKN